MPTGQVLFSLDFVVNRFFMKMFRTSNMDVVIQCQSYYDFKLPSTKRLMLNMPPAGAAL